MFTSVRTHHIMRDAFATVGEDSKLTTIHAIATRRTCSSATPGSPTGLQVSGQVPDPTCKDNAENAQLRKPLLHINHVTSILLVALGTCRKHANARSPKASLNHTRCSTIPTHNTRLHHQSTHHHHSQCPEKSSPCKPASAATPSAPPSGKPSVSPLLRAANNSSNALQAKNTLSPPTATSKLWRKELIARMCFSTSRMIRGIFLVRFCWILNQE